MKSPCNVEKTKMFKMFHARAHKGSMPELWEENWEHNDFDEALRFCEKDPLRPLFERFALPGTKMLEGGCGNGQYVAYLAERGVQVVGLDFAQATLRRLHARNSTLLLCAGDVGALPFGSETFDLYYSGGVVEHFESGPMPALKEAFRVLKPGGVLMVSVPYVSVLRRILLPFRSTFWKRVTQSEESYELTGHGLEFFQYVYRRREFEKLLAKTGFHVSETQGYGILWGMYDTPHLQRLVEKFAGRSMPPDVAMEREPSAGNGAEAVPHSNVEADSGARSIIKRLLISEDDTIPVAGLGVRLMRLVCANMMMYVCVRPEA